MFVNELKTKQLINMENLSGKIEIVVLTKAQLKDFALNVAKIALEQYINEKENLSSWITNKQATTLLNKKSRLTVDNMAKRGLIEKKYEGTKPLYKKSDVLKWVDS